MTSDLFLLECQKLFSKPQKNIDYLIEFKKSEFNINICIIDSDSIDGTKGFVKICYKKNI